MEEQREPQKPVDETEDDISDLELQDDVLEKKMRKLEAEANRLLHHSSELLKALNMGTSKQEESKDIESNQTTNAGDKDEII